MKRTIRVHKPIYIWWIPSETLNINRLIVQLIEYFLFIKVFILQKTVQFEAVIP